MTPEPAAAKSDTEAPTETEQQPEPAVDPKEQMRQALAKKNAQQQAGQAHLEGRPKAGGEHDRAGGPRQFRRKSGS